MVQRSTMYSQTARMTIRILLVMLLLTACGQATGGSTLSSAGVQTGPTAAPATLTPILAGSEMVVGSNRLPIGVVKSGTPINDPSLKLHLRFFYLEGPETEQTKVRSEADAVRAFRSACMSPTRLLTRPELGVSRRR